MADVEAAHQSRLKQAERLIDQYYAGTLSPDQMEEMRRIEK